MIVPPLRACSECFKTIHPERLKSSPNCKTCSAKCSRERWLGHLRVNARKQRERQKAARRAARQGNAA